jgi:hypothetical protein
VRNSEGIIRRRLRWVHSLAPQIRQLFRDPQFDLVLSDDEKAAWNAFRHVATGLRGNVKAVNFRKLVDELVNSYE